MKKIVGFISKEIITGVEPFELAYQQLLEFGVSVENIIVAESTAGQTPELGLSDCLDILIEGDQLVVSNLDHLGASVDQISSMALWLHSVKIDVVVLPNPKLNSFNDQKLALAVEMLQNTSLSYYKVGLLLNMAPSTLYRYIAPSGEIRESAYRRLARRVF